MKHAVQIAKKNDIVVLAGKGHETYQIIGHEKYPFDEKEIIKEIINEKNKYKIRRRKWNFI